MENYHDAHGSANCCDWPRIVSCNLLNDRPRRWAQLQRRAGRGNLLDGHFDDYMQWLATNWKKQEEAAKKAGLITKYQVLVAQPQGPNDPDIYLIVEYKNWAALDGLGGKFDAVTAQVEGSIEKANQSEVDRAKIRTVLGAKTVQVAELK